MSILQLPHASPEVILIDWHATLVNTHDAMYHAVDDVLPRLKELGLEEELVSPEESKTIEDAKLVKYVRDHHKLHPKIVAQRKISRTDIFQVLFGDNEDAKYRVHRAFDNCYRKYVGEVHPLEADIPSHLKQLRALGIKLGVLTNRNRDFMEKELQLLEEGSWVNLFDCTACGDDVERRKPAPDLIYKALEFLDHPADEHCWYLGDSTTDIVAAKEAGVTGVFYNGAQWDQAWLNKIFPGTTRHPHVPDAVVEDIPGLVNLARWVLAQDLRTRREIPGQG